MTGLIAIFAILSVASFPLKTVQYDISDENIKVNTKIVHISDLHSCFYGKNMKNLVNQIYRENPDIVVLTGDIFDEVIDNNNSLVFLEAIAPKYTCYMVAGNHEDACRQWNEYKNIISDYGVKILEGDTFIIDNSNITISGASKSYSKGISFEESLNRCKNNVSNDTYNILLAHYPSRVDEYQKNSNFDLILCGHAHGGQWRIPYLVNGLYAPNEGLFPQYAGGRYKLDNGEMIVSRGLSRIKQIIPRIFNNPELVVINLSHKNNTQS